MKKILTIIALAICSMTMMAQELHVGDLYYDIIQIEGGYAAQIVYHRSYQDLQSVVIPESITYLGLTMPVTSIDWSAFEDCDSLISVTIPSSVIAIGSEAFDGTALYNNPDNWQNGALWIDSCLIEASEYIPNKYTISDNVRLIADEAFTWCTSLTLVTIPNSVKSIGYAAFEDCSSLTSIVVDVANKYYDSRGNCNAIIDTSTDMLIVGCKNTTIPNSVTGIDWRAFKGHSSLTAINIPNSVTGIGGDAFEGTALYDDPANWENGALYVNDCLIKVDTSFVGNFKIKENTRLIADWAFDGCYKLTSVTIPNSVTSIGISAFRDCESLTSVTIPKSVTHIGDYAFHYCSSLETIVFEGTWKQWHAIDKGAFWWTGHAPATHVQCTDGEVEL